MSYSVLTPYLVPSEINHQKAVNIGDGFILKSILNLLNPYRCQYVFTTRKKLTDENIKNINSTKALILAGANQLNDNFSILPGAEQSFIDKIQVPIIPFGIGIYGVPSNNSQMSLLTQEILKNIHTKIKYSSWRCNLSIDYLQEFLPELNHKILMTGCPVMYHKNILSNKQFQEKSKLIIVTVTERADFWERETETIKFVKERFPNSRKILSLHQDFAALGVKQHPKKNILRFWDIEPQLDSEIIKLRKYAQQLGFRIFKPKSVEQCWRLYNKCDLHIGSRVHAHLYFLSQAKKSFLTYVDDRCLGFAQTLNFPICDFTNIEDYLDYNFEIYRQNCQLSFENMKQFLFYLKEDVLK
ncbi:MAG: polysaccharide pyruvyl transferase family protein [Xenococcus sp. (in: cyanobacteria)]